MLKMEWRSRGLFVAQALLLLGAPFCGVCQALVSPGAGEAPLESTVGGCSRSFATPLGGWIDDTQFASSRRAANRFLDVQYGTGPRDGEWTYPVWGAAMDEDHRQIIQLNGTIKLPCGTTADRVKGYFSGTVELLEDDGRFGDPIPLNGTVMLSLKEETQFGEFDFLTFFLFGYKLIYRRAYSLDSRITF